jgi:hypothetical protein
MSDEQRQINARVLVQLAEELESMAAEVWETTDTNYFPRRSLTTIKIRLASIRWHLGLDPKPLKFEGEDQLYKT